MAIYWYLQQPKGKSLSLLTISVFTNGNIIVNYRTYIALRQGYLCNIITDESTAHWVKTPNQATLSGR